MSGKLPKAFSLTNLFTGSDMNNQDVLDVCQLEHIHTYYRLAISVFTLFLEFQVFVYLSWYGYVQFERTSSLYSVYTKSCVDIVPIGPLVTAFD